jgi:glutamate racemase
MNNLPICFFDSGVGGLSVYAHFKQKMPFENTIYFGDLKNLPYGNKTQEELIGFARNILNFFKSKDAKAVVIACNTSSALAYEKVKDEYDFKIYPIIQSCAKVLASMDVSKYGVFATPGTVNSHAYKQEINNFKQNCEVFELACPNWVSIVEGRFDKKEAILDIENKIARMRTFNPDKIILGCTHYPYLMNILVEYLPKDIFVDPAEIFVDYIIEDLLKNALSTNKTIGSENFYVSAFPEMFRENARAFYDINDKQEIVTVTSL